MKKTVAVLMGGWSSERDVSLVSGRACAHALRDAGYNVREIDVKKDLGDLLLHLTPKPDVVFNALHGEGGEDGVIQSVLEILGVPYTHSSPLASALAMNKQKTKEVLSAHGIKSPKGFLVAIEDLKAGKIPLPQPYVLKPNAEGSSVGVFIVREDTELEEALQNWSYGAYALMEEYIAGRELSVAVMGDKLGREVKALTVTEIVTDRDFYNYDAKYGKNGSRHVVPAEIPKEVFDKAKQIAEIAHEKLGCIGVSRSDFRYNDSVAGGDGLYFLETNTQPGMTPTSLTPEQAAYCYISFNELVVFLVENASLNS